MKLHENDKAPSPRRVRIFLAEKGIEVPRVNVDLRGGEQLSDAFRRELNPGGTVPVLELDDGTYIAETMAICRYFEAIQPEPALLGTDAQSIAIIEMWNRRAEIGGLLAVFDIFRNTHPAFVDRGLPGAPVPVPQIPALAERERGTLARTLAIADAQLGRHPFLAGDHYSVADITLQVTLGMAARLGLDGPPANVQRWYAEVSARPSASA